MRLSTRNRFRKGDKVIITSCVYEGMVHERGEILGLRKINLPGRWYAVMTCTWGATIHESRIVFDD